MAAELHCYDYVNQPFETVRHAILADPERLFRSATTRTGAGAFHVEIGKLQLGSEIEVELGGVTENRESPERPRTTVAIAWRSRRSPTWFPVMNAVLSIFPLSPTETQLELSGTYKAPGVVDDAVDIVALRKLAQKAVATFIREVTTFLRTNLAEVALVPEMQKG